MSKQTVQAHLEAVQAFSAQRLIQKQVTKAILESHTSRAHRLTHSRTTIAAIHNHIRARHVARRITRQIEIRTLQLVRLALSAHRDLIFPDILRLLGYEITNLRRHVPGRYAVGARKLYPFNRQTATEMDNPRFSPVVRRLQLRDIDHVAGHRGCGDEGAGLEVFQFVFLLVAPYGSTGARAVEGAVQIGADYLAVVVDLTVDHGALGPGNAGVGNEDVEAVVELGDLGFNCFFDFGGVLHVDLVGIACRSG